MITYRKLVKAFGEYQASYSKQVATNKNNSKISEFKSQWFTEKEAAEKWLTKETGGCSNIP